MSIDTHTIKIKITFTPSESETEHTVFEASTRVGFNEACNPAGSAAALLAKVPSAEDLAVMISDEMDDQGLSCNPE